MKTKEFGKNEMESGAFKEQAKKQIREYDQIAEWLVELQMYKSLAPRELISQKQRNDREMEYCKGFIDGYSKAIDNFVEKLKSDEFQKYKLDMVFETSRDLTYSQCVNAFHEYIDKIAEQLKGNNAENY